MANSPIYNLIFSSRAQKEVTESWNWYEDRQQGLGDRFLKELTECIHIIEQTPTRYPTRFKSYKETPVPVFPFLIIYRIQERKSVRQFCKLFD